MSVSVSGREGQQSKTRLFVLGATGGIGRALVEQARQRGHHDVLSALGPPGLGPTTLVADSARSTVAAMRATGARRLLVVGVAVLFEDGGLLNAIARRTFLRNVARDSAEMECIVCASRLDWTIARPPRLTDGVLTRAYVVADGRMPPASGLSISRADVADFLLDEVAHPAHVHRRTGAC